MLKEVKTELKVLQEKLTIALNRKGFIFLTNIYKNIHSNPHNSKTADKWILGRHNNSIYRGRGHGFERGFFRDMGKVKGSAHMENTL